MHGRNSTDSRCVRGAAVLAFVVCGLATTEALAQRVPTHVACVGDSITYGYLASSSSKSYPSDLQNIFGSSVRVMNFGRNSATMLSNGDLPYINQSEYTAATNFVSGAGTTAVVDVIIMLGTNDSKSYNWSPQPPATRAQQFMTDAGNMVDHFTTLGTHPVVYLAIPPAIYTNTFGISESVTSNEIAPIIRQVATQKGMPIIDVHTPTAGHPEYFSDGVHPTDAGYMLVAQIMHDGLLASSGSGGAGGAGGRGGAGGAAGRGGSGGTGAGGAGGGQGGMGGSSGRGGTGGAGGGAAGTTGTAGRGGSTGGGTAGAGGGQGGQGGQGGIGGLGGSSGRGGGGGSATGGAAGAGTGGTSAGTGGTAASGTGGTSAGTSGTTGGTGAAAGTGGTSAAGTGGTASGTAGTSAGGADGGGGCGCGVDTGPRSGLTVALTLLLAIPWLRRRRRRS